MKQNADDQRRARNDSDDSRSRGRQERPTDDRTQRRCERNSRPIDAPVPWTPKPGKPKRDLVLPIKTNSPNPRPMHAERRAKHLRAIALGRKWLQDLISGKAADVETIAAREGRSARSVNMMISLAFVAPDIIEAAVAGRLPRGIGITRLVDLPLSWAEQKDSLGPAGKVLITPQSHPSQCANLSPPCRPSRPQRDPWESPPGPSEDRTSLCPVRTESPRHRVTDSWKRFGAGRDNGGNCLGYGLSSASGRVPETNCSLK